LIQSRSHWTIQGTGKNIFEKSLVKVMKGDGEENQELFSRQKF